MKAFSCVSAISVAILTACGGGGTGGPGDAGFSAPPATGTVAFKLSATSCNAGASMNLRFFISGREVGSEKLFGGQTSRGYTANAGANEWSASATDVAGRPQGSWLGQVTVPEAGSTTVELSCTVKK